MNTRQKGTDKEQLAAAYLTKQGMRVVTCNFRGKQGEIDIIGYHGNYLVFVEVKYRKNKQKGYAAEAVNLSKQKRICRVADYYRFLHKLGTNTMVRYDVVAIQDNQIEWIQNAFWHHY